MRPLPLSTALLPAFLFTMLAVGPAAAQSSGWVDPPAKSAEGDGAKGALGAAPAPAPQPEATSAGQPEARAAEAPARRPKAAELRRERRMAARPARPDFAPDETGSSDQAGAAQRLAAAYLRTVSAPGIAMVADAPRFYGERVRFHGRLMSLSALMQEKSRFARRWPERRYAPHGAMRTACEHDTCSVRTAFDFRAQNPESGARSQGSAELTLTIDFGQGRPRIVSESSRVLRYGSPLAEEAERTGRGA